MASALLPTAAALQAPRPRLAGARRRVPAAAALRPRRLVITHYTVGGCPRGFPAGLAGCACPAAAGPPRSRQALPPGAEPPPLRCLRSLSAAGAARRKFTVVWPHSPAAALTSPVAPLPCHCSHFLLWRHSPAAAALSSPVLQKEGENIDMGPPGKASPAFKDMKNAQAGAASGAGRAWRAWAVQGSGSAGWVP